MLEVQRLVKRYRGATHNAVDGISFEVRAGEFFALLGPNGAGKTTTISIITTTLTPTAGSVRIDGVDVHREPTAVRRQIGIIFQNPSLDMNLTGEENVRLHAILYRLYPFRPSYRLMPAEYRRHMHDMAAVLGMETDMFRPVRQLSGGMRRKLEIIRGLMHRPRILFLDEPTAGLDAASRRSLWAYLADIRKGQETTVVLTTHYLEEAEAADRILILNHGQIVAQGSPDQVKAGSESAIQAIPVQSAKAPTRGAEYLEIDAEDRDSLRRELIGLGVHFDENRHFLVYADGRAAYEIVRSIATPLCVMRTRQVSLEDVYLRLIAPSNAED